MRRTGASAEFRADLAGCYRAALAHYDGDKDKARACVEAYCAGRNGSAPLRTKEKR